MQGQSDILNLILKEKKHYFHSVFDVIPDQ